MEVFRELPRRGGERKRRGVDVDQAKDAIMPAIAGLMTRITGHDRVSNDAFRLA